MNVDDDRPQPLELVGVELHLGLEHVSRLGDDRGQDARSDPASEVRRRRQRGVEHLSGHQQLRLGVEHEVQAREWGVPEESRDQAAGHAAQPLGPIDLPEGGGHPAVAVDAALEAGLDHGDGDQGYAAHAASYHAQGD